MRMDLVIRFGYGSMVPWVRRVDGLLCAVAGPDALALWTPIATRGEDMTTVADFTVSATEHIPFVLTWYPSHETPPRPVDASYAVHDTQMWWEDWAATCTFEGEWRDPVMRSLITLKALTYQPTGGIVAAATTSLPETLGGERNWDYRYCWLRDATLTLESLMRGGFHEEALAWRDWLLRAVAGDVTQLQIMYGPAGERRLDEWEVDWLPGYEGSAPVRVGNAASGQFQLDVYGEVLSALYEACGVGSAISAVGLGPADRAGGLRGEALGGARRGHLGGARPAPALHPLQGHGLGGGRPGRAHHRGVRGRRAARRTGATCATASTTRCAPRGTTQMSGAFTQYYGSDALDASLLMIPLVGFLPATDERVRSTIEVIERGLTEDGFVLRYRTEDSRGRGRAHRSRGGLPGVLVLDGRLPVPDRPLRRRPCHARPAHRPEQRPRVACRGVRRPSRDAWWGTSPRPSRTCRSSTPPTTCRAMPAWTEQVVADEHLLRSTGRRWGRAGSMSGLAPSHRARAARSAAPAATTRTTKRRWAR